MSTQVRQLWLTKKDTGGGHGWTYAPFTGQTNLVEWDQIVFPLSHSPDEAKLAGRHSRVVFVRRMRELISWASAGRTLLLIADMPIEGLFDDATLAPLQGLKSLDRHGSQVDPVNLRTAVPGLSEYVNALRYIQLVDAQNARPFLVVKQTLPGPMQPVGLVFECGAGFIVVAPPASGGDILAHYGKLFSVPNALAGQPAALPDWADLFVPSVDVPACNRIRAARVAINRAQAELQAAEKELELTSWLRVLFAGTGDDFMHAVDKGLSDLGFTVVAVPGKRTDLFARDGDRLLVVETKGLLGAAKTADFAQLQRWMADTNATILMDEDGRSGDPHLAQCAEGLARLGFDLPNTVPKEVKGALIISTYKDTPIDQRAGPDFPDDMLREVRRAGVCALTGLQLLALVTRARTDAATAAGAREAIFASVGQLPTQVWQDFISKT